MKQEFKIVSLNISSHTGTRKKSTPKIVFIPGKGVENDAHAGKIELRQVSLLSMDDVLASSAYAQAKGKGYILQPGDFAENLTTSGIAWYTLPLGTKLYIGESVLEISQIGKSCHAGCEITKLVGECVMPTKGVFARVLKGGEVSCESSCYYDIG